MSTVTILGDEVAAMNEQMGFWGAKKSVVSLGAAPEKEEECMLSRAEVEFIQTSLGSVCALQLMLTLLARPERAWTVQELVLEMRASAPLISNLLERFRGIGLAEENGSVWHWRPVTDEIEDISWQVAEAHIVTPFAVVNTIAHAPASAAGPVPDAMDPA